MIDPFAALSLRELFTASAQDSPHLVREAQILFSNDADSTMRFKADTPAAAAEILQHIVNNEGSGIFSRKAAFDTVNPFYFRMDKRVRLKADNKQHQMMAFNFAFRELNKPSLLWLSDPKVNDYFWQGDEKIENKPPFSCEGPSIHQMITTLKKAGKDWGKVDFVAPRHRSHLRLVK